jgi:hypothetical protein
MNEGKLSRSAFSILLRRDAKFGLHRLAGRLRFRHPQLLPGRLDRQGSVEDTRQRESE